MCFFTEILNKMGESYVQERKSGKCLTLVKECFGEEEGIEIGNVMRE